MTAAQLSAGDDPHHLGHASELAENGPAPLRIVVGYGFWIFLISDIIMFAAFFATYAVLVTATAGGPAPRDLFDLRNAGIETACLLVSSFTCGLASIAVAHKRALLFYTAMVATGLFGFIFFALEMKEFYDLIERGAGPTRSAFLSAFFALVGCHGLHITAGGLWLGTMVAQVFAKGFRDDIGRRFLCFSLFWHALDIIWVAIFTIVYLIGVQT